MDSSANEAAVSIATCRPQLRSRRWLDRLGEKGVVARSGAFEMRICYVLTNCASDYQRTRSLLAALRALPGVECYTAINSSKGLHRYRETLARVADIRRLYRPDLYLLGFRGYELYWPLK